MFFNYRPKLRKHIYNRELWVRKWMKDKQNHRMSLTPKNPIHFQSSKKVTWHSDNIHLWHLLTAEIMAVVSLCQKTNCQCDNSPTVLYCTAKFCLGNREHGNSFTNHRKLCRLIWLLRFHKNLYMNKVWLINSCNKITLAHQHFWFIWYCTSKKSWLISYCK